MDNPPREKIATDENFIELNGANLSGKSGGAEVTDQAKKLI